MQYYAKQHQRKGVDNTHDASYATVPAAIKPPARQSDPRRNGMAPVKNPPKSGTQKEKQQGKRKSQNGNIEKGGTLTYLHSQFLP